jgi:hypothetical protein
MFWCPPFGKITGFELPVLRGDLESEVVPSSITETESKEKFRPNVFWS